MTSLLTPDIYDRLAHVMEAKRLTAYRFSKELGFDKPAKLYSILRRKTKPSFETLVSIATTYEDIDCNWLLRGTGDAFRGDSTVSITAPDIPELTVTLKESNPAQAASEQHVALLEERTEVLRQQVADRDDVILHLKEEIFFLREMIRQRSA